MCPSRIPKGKSRGWIIPVGGAEVKENNPSILSRFVKLCGGSKARIAIIPTASRLLETGPKYERIFKALGAKSAVSVDFETRKHGSDPERLAVFDGVTGQALEPVDVAPGGPPLAEIGGQVVRHRRQRREPLLWRGAPFNVLVERHVLPAGSSPAPRSERRRTCAG